MRRTEPGLYGTAQELAHTFAHSLEPHKGPRFLSHHSATSLPRSLNNPYTMDRFHWGKWFFSVPVPPHWWVVQ